MVTKPQAFAHLTPTEMQKIIDDYFEECESKKQTAVITGLAWKLDVERTTIYRYANKSAKHLKNWGSDAKRKCNIVKKAFRRCAAIYEQRMVDGKGSTIGLIFAHKNHFGWMDKQEIEHTSGSVTVSFESKKAVTAPPILLESGDDDGTYDGISEGQEG